MIDLTHTNALHTNRYWHTNSHTSAHEISLYKGGNACPKMTYERCIKTINLFIPYVQALLTVLANINVRQTAERKRELSLKHKQTFERTLEQDFFVGRANKCGVVGGSLCQHWDDSQRSDLVNNKT
jgi:hypothetical protein